MKQESKQYVITTIQQFKLPSYQQIPTVGLYLDQTVKFINQVFEPLPNMEITSSMISNYVKQGIIERPVKKMYSRDQICYLMFIVLGKMVLSMESIQLLFEVQKNVYDEETAYEYLRLELENILQYVFGLKDHLDSIGHTVTDEKMLLRHSIMSIAHKVHLELCFEAIKKEDPSHLNTY